MKDYDSLGKYAKLAIISSLNRPRSLSELGIVWFSENGRFYKKRALDDVKEAQEHGYLSFDNKKLVASRARLLDELFEGDAKAREAFEAFMEHEFSKEVYFDLEVIQAFVKGSPDKAACLSPRTLLTAPLLLHVLEQESSKTHKLVIKLLGLDEYTHKINEKSELHIRKFRNLNDSIKWKKKLDAAAEHNI